MKKPNMIIFDYGNTLLHEAGIDFKRGEKELYKHITKNPNNYTYEEISIFGSELFAKMKSCRHHGYELHEWNMMRLKYEYLGIELAITYAEAEKIIWDNASIGASMPHVEEMLDYLKNNGIRSGVISNANWSGNALSERINRLLPNNQFEFILVSSEYGIRKPNPMIFELALKKANLQASDVWFCGDNISADVYGAKNSGMFPVHYEEKSIENPWLDKNDILPIDFEHLHIHNWTELITLLETL